MNIQFDPQIVSQPKPPSIDLQKKSQDLTSLRESSREFEALLVMEMFKSMRKSLPEGGLFEKSLTTDVFQGMLDMEYSRATAKGKGMGIGEAMYKQLEQHVSDKQ